MVDFEHFSQTTCSSEQLKMNMSDKRRTFFAKFLLILLQTLWSPFKKKL